MLAHMFILTHYMCKTKNAVLSIDYEKMKFLLKKSFPTAPVGTYRAHFSILFIE